MLSQETEIKIDLASEANYRKLLAHFPEREEERLQENYFLDTPDWRLSRNGWALRIRIQEDRASITLKGASSESRKGLAVRPEIIAELPKATALTFLENDIESVSLLPSSIISALNIPPSNEKLELKLSFRNHRVTVPHRFGPHDLKLEIDCTHYSTGPDDYELEVELSSPEIYPEVMDSLAQLLGSLEIPVIFHARSKFARGLLRLSPKERPKKITP